MLGSLDSQNRLFATDNNYLEYIGENTFYGFLAKQRHRLFHDEEFADLYCPDNGRPSVPPSLMAVALLLQAHDKVSDAEATSRSRYDLRWKVALGLEIDENLFAKSTLQTFRAQLIIHDKVGKLFKASLEEARLKGLFGGRRKLKLAVDTTPIFGKGAVKDTYNLLADGIRQLARELARILERPLKEWAHEHDLDRYFGSSIKGESDVDWSDEGSKRAFLTSIVDDAARLLVIARNVRSTLDEASADDRAIVEASELLRTLLLQDVEPQPDGEFAIKRGTVKDRTVSTTDPEMRAGHKSASSRFEGHKASVAVDIDTGLIADVDVIAGNAPDNSDVLALVEGSEENTGMEVETTIGDCAYGDGATRQAFANEGRDLVARVPKRPKRATFPKEDFVIDLEAETVTCPAGNTTRTWRWVKSNGQRVRQFTFPASLCNSCALRSKCTTQSSLKSYGRTVTLHPQEALLQEARIFQRTDAFGDCVRRRQVVEHRLARLVQLGIRQSRFFGRIKTKFQLILAATVANFTLLMNADAIIAISAA
ncbi:MAG: IS1182 family transposase [Candidatus Zixiibacteriota bacterium]|nr:MAG: IS1182 family transposase [candidate division Zixibacteria bacterium]